ncbi:SDR family NAD(P)-dependent oxidoreductase [Pelagibacteraceae bacterium]|nr:SDR family NAD(P)-dependent oxidoreductase [Pelagibacteraceae bacterium]
MFLKKLIQKKINQDFKKKFFILTGYSSGIGNKLFKDLNLMGSNLILIGRKKIKSSHYFNCDLRDSEELQKTIKIISKKYKKIDGFVHCAGVNQCVKSEKISLLKWNEVFSVNLTPAFLITKEIKNNLKKSKNPSVVFISSIAGHRKSVISGTHYVSSKAGLIGLAKQFSHEFGKDKIRVNCICPSQTFTRMLKQSMSKNQISNLEQNIPLGRLAEVEEQSYGIIFLLSSFSKYISGTSLKIDGGQI